MGQNKKGRTKQFFNNVEQAANTNHARSKIQEYNFNKLVKSGVILTEREKENGQDI